MLAYGTRCVKVRKQKEVGDGPGDAGFKVLFGPMVGKETIGKASLFPGMALPFLAHI